MTNATQRFYDQFSSRFVRDYVWGNLRVERQLKFLAAAIPPAVRTALVIGCGSGESARFVAHRVARGSTVLGVDISSESLRLARALNSHPRVRYEQLDVLSDELEGIFDVVILPDVYEHIPAAMRRVLHQKLDGALAEEGRVLLTFPSPGHQAALAAAGEGLQIVDEVVTLDDMRDLARDVRAELTYFNLISVWRANDYVHAGITRGTGTVKALDDRTRIPLQSTRDGLPIRVGMRFGVDRPVRLMRAGYRYLRLRIRLRRLGGGPLSSTG